MKLNLKHFGRGVFRATGLRAIIRGQCRSVNLSIRISEPSTIVDSYSDVALNKVLMPQIAVMLEKMDYAPGITSCVDCSDCENKCFTDKEVTINEAD